MGKSLSLAPRTWTQLEKHRHIFAKIFVSIIFVGITYRLFFNRSLTFSAPLSGSHQLQASPSRNPYYLDKFLSGDIQNNDPQASSDNDGGGKKSPADKMEEPKNAQTQTEKCDLFSGEWIPNPSEPIYNNVSCPIVQGHQNCMKNGRPDSGYLYWRWKPRDCELPSFDPTKFLNSMRNKALAFIGDSICRNQVESLVCLLSVEAAAIEYYHDEEYKSKKWKFSPYNFTLAVIWSPLLLQAEINEDQNGVSKSIIQLHLDVLDKKWTDEYRNFDYIVTSGGKWFLKAAIYREKNTQVGCHHCERKDLTELGFGYAYRKALHNTFDFFNKSDYKGMLILRTSTPDHFENGQWSSGGICNRTVPFREGEVSLIDNDRTLRSIELEEFQMAANFSKYELKLLDTTQLSLLRPDGHPGPYRQFHPFAEDKNAKVQNDCLHWCLPGPIDSWNDILMKMILDR